MLRKIISVHNVGRFRSSAGTLTPACQAHNDYGCERQINGYTSQYHHGENAADATPDLIDPNELTGFTRRPLKFVPPPPVQ